MTFRFCAPLVLTWRPNNENSNRQWNSHFIQDINFFSNHFPPKCGPPLTFQWILYFTRGAMHHRSNYECQFCIMRLVRARVTGFSFSSVLSRLRVDLKFFLLTSNPTNYRSSLSSFLLQPLALPLPRNISLSSPHTPDHTCALSSLLLTSREVQMLLMWIFIVGKFLLIY